MERPRPPQPLPDRQDEKRSKIEQARDEYAAGRISLRDLEWHVERALREEIAP